MKTTFIEEELEKSLTGLTDEDYYNLHYKNADYSTILDKVYEFIKIQNCVTCVLLANRFGKGDGSIEREDQNFIIFFGMSEHVTNAVSELLLDKTRQVLACPSTPLVYFVDGGVLRLPLVRRPPAGGYKEMHWLPTALGYAPECKRSGCKKYEKLLKAQEEVKRLMQ